jgi:hypothetical protein
MGGSVAHPLDWNQMFARLRLLPLIVLAFSLVAAAQSDRFEGIVHPSLPLFEFRVHLENNAGALAGGFQAIDRIEVRSAGRRTQTIRFADDTAPAFRGPWRDVVYLEDVDCDGYKDLLVRTTMGIHGDAWYRLYRFDQVRDVFVEYPRFSKLPLKRVDCPNKSITTYVNSGAAGCEYESAVYRWVNGELQPVRVESQEVAEGGGFTRTVRTWDQGKETAVKQRVSPDDCHHMNEP